MNKDYYNKQKDVFSDIYYFSDRHKLVSSEEEWRQIREEEDLLKRKYYGTEVEEFFHKMFRPIKNNILKKNDSERELFFDIYTLLMKYNIPRDDELYWAGLVSESNRIYEKYKDIPFTGDFAKELILSVIGVIETQWKNNNMSVGQAV